MPWFSDVWTRLWNILFIKYCDSHHVKFNTYMSGQQSFDKFAFWLKIKWKWFKVCNTILLELKHKNFREIFLIVKVKNRAHVHFVLAKFHCWKGHQFLEVRNKILLIIKLPCKIVFTHFFFQIFKTVLQNFSLLPTHYL